MYIAIPTCLNVGNSQLILHIMVNIGYMNGTFKGVYRFVQSSL